ncbi:MAG: YrbL family protein [Alphaproteobacteria bacterium]|nr:YrbL family protein [Alphaproteobacteria bacterium]
MIELKRSDCFAGGLHRDCFVHPDDRSLCIKVSKGHGAHESRREIKYYEHLARRRISWEHLPRFHGCVDTSLGIGTVFDLIRDHDGEISQTLEGRLASSPLLEADRARLAQSLRTLKNYLIEQRIITRTLKAKNILCNKPDRESVRLVLCDNIGNTDFIPICSFVDFLATKKIIRKWRRFESDIGVAALPGANAPAHAVGHTGSLS